MEFNLFIDTSLSHWHRSDIEGLVDAPLQSLSDTSIARNTTGFMWPRRGNTVRVRGKTKSEAAEFEERLLCLFV